MDLRATTRLTILIKEKLYIFLFSFEKYQKLAFVL
jgi:hypothetical protein